MVTIPMVVDDMYPDNFPPEIGWPLIVIGLSWFTIATLKERRVNSKGTK